MTLKVSHLWLQSQTSGFLEVFIACMLSHFIHVWLCVTLWTTAFQVPLSMGFFKQEYWSRLLCLPLGHLPDPEIEPISLRSPALAGRFITTSAPWEAHLSHPDFLEAISLKWDLNLIKSWAIEGKQCNLFSFESACPGRAYSSFSFGFLTCLSNQELAQKGRKQCWTQFINRSPVIGKRGWVSSKQRVEIK